MLVILQNRREVGGDSFGYFSKPGAKELTARLLTGRAGAVTLNQSKSVQQYIRARRSSQILQRIIQN